MYKELIQVDRTWEDGEQAGLTVRWIRVEGKMDEDLEDGLRGMCYFLGALILVLQTVFLSVDCFDTGSP